MNKETEELILLGVGGFLLLSLLTNSGANAAAKLQANENITYANDAAGLLNTVANDTLGD